MMEHTHTFAPKQGSDLKTEYEKNTPWDRLKVKICPTEHRCMFA